MRNSNIVRLDSKGRLLIPIHIRDMLKAEEGTEVVIMPGDDKSHIKVLPMLRDRTAEMRLLIQDAPGSLAGIADILAKNKIDIIMSESRTLAKGQLAEWSIIMDTSNFNGKSFDSLKRELLGSKVVKEAEVLRE